MFVSGVSFVGSGLCEGLITSLEESCLLCDCLFVCGLETSAVRWLFNKVLLSYAWLRASVAVQMRSSLFWNVIQRRLVVTDVSGEPTARPLKMGPMSYPETLVAYYQCTSPNNPEQRRSVFSPVCNYTQLNKDV